MASIDMVQLRTDLKRDEGTVLHAYQDSLGYWTIGSGILIDERKGGGITDGENDFLLDNRITKTINELDDNIPWLGTKSDGVQRALVNMAYEMGVDGILKFHEMLAAIKDDNYEEAAQQAQNSLWAQQLNDDGRVQRIMSLLKAG